MKKFLFVLLVLSVATQVCFSQIVETKKEGGKYGFVDKDGKWVVRPKYYYAQWLGKFGYFAYEFEEIDLKGCILEDGTEVIPPGKYDSYYIDEDQKQYIQVEDVNGYKGLVNLMGELVVPCKYERIFFLSDNVNYATVADFSGNRGLVDLKGNLIVPCKFKEVYAWKKYCFAKDDKGKKYAYSFTGKLLGSGGSLGDTKHTIIFCRDDLYCGAVDYDGKVILPYEYNSISNASDGILLVRRYAKLENGKWVGGKYGYVSEIDGKEIIPCIYDYATAFTNDVATVKKDGEVKLIKNPLKDGSQIQIADNRVAAPKKEKAKPGPAVSRYPAPDSDVDKNIPQAKMQNKNLFAFIIANENYADAPVPYSLNDGRMFKEYCQKTLGIPDKNINLYEDATFGGIITAVEKMKAVADAYDGEASIIFYYAGHGFPDDQQSTAYLLPVDGDASSIKTTGYSLAKLYKEIAALPLKSSVVFLDACFSGAKREDQMLASARGVAIKVKDEAPQGNMVVFSAAQGDETAHQMEEKHHGLFTYCLLKELQQSSGNITLGTLTDNVTKMVKRQSVVINNKKQTPTVIPSASLQATWRDMKLK